MKASSHSSVVESKRKKEVLNLETSFHVEFDELIEKNRKWNAINEFRPPRIANVQIRSIDDDNGQRSKNAWAFAVYMVSARIRSLLSP